MKYQGFELIDWRDRSLGAMNRTASWLLEVIGVGNTFTMRRLREAVPGREQVGRRMRQLRDYGWRIDERRDDDSLKSDELRLVQPGLAVWVRAERATAELGQVSDKTRQAVFKRDGHSCVRCGIAAGDFFDDRGGVKARLTLAHKYPAKLRHATGAFDFVTACQRCNESLRQFTDVYRDGAQVWEAVRELSKKEQAELLRWIREGGRPSTTAECVYREFRQLSAEERDEVARKLEERCA